MKICFYLAHPAHFHLFKNVIKSLKNDHEILVLYNEKDVLEQLVKGNCDSKLYKVKTDKVKTSFLGLFRQFIQKIWGSYKAIKEFKPNIVIGTPVVISLLSTVLNYKSIIVNEDDFDVIKLTSNLGYPFAHHIICPEVCRKGRFESKCITYPGYHELAYLHPDHFNSDPNIAKKYVDINNPYFLIRFAKLAAHHDMNIRGINSSVSSKLIKKLQEKGKVYITSERPLEREFEQYRLSIDPADMHHVLAYADLYIGDSQTMAAEAGILGVPFIRYNDFVGKISYLDELEKVYKLGYGISPNEPENLLRKVDELLNDKNLKVTQAKKVNKMMEKKINVADFLIWFIDKYPESLNMNYRKIKQ